MATNDPSKTMFGISPFNLNDEEGEKDANPGNTGGAAAAAAARESEQAAKRALFFDEDGWDVPEDRITGSFPASGAGPLAKPDLGAAIGLTESQASGRASIGSGTMRFRADQLMMPEEPAGAASEPEPSTSARPFSGTMMFSAQNMADALSAMSEDAPPTADPVLSTESEPADAPDTAQMRGLRDEEIEEARVPVESRPFTGTMRLRRIDLMAGEEGHKTTQEVDLSFLASATGAHQMPDSPASPRASVAADGSGATTSTGGSVHGQPQWATMPVGAAIESTDEVVPPTGEHRALEVVPDAAAASPGTDVDDGLAAEIPPSDGTPSLHDSGTPIGGSPVTDEVPESTPEAAATASSAAAAVSPVAKNEPETAPVVESKRPAVTQPTQLMPALTLPPSIAGERDQVLDRLVAPTRPSHPPVPSTEAGPSPWLIALFIVAAITILTLAALFVLR